jgi:hypothetical protein
VNAKARINVPVGASLTQVAVLPPVFQRDLTDPFAEKKRPWALYWTLAVLALIALGWFLGKFDNYLPPSFTSAHIIRGAGAR